MSGSFKNRGGLDKRFAVLMTSTALREKFLDDWYNIHPESYDKLYELNTERRPGGTKSRKPVKGITLIAQLSDEWPQIFNKIWNRKPYKDLNKTIKAYDGPIQGWDPSTPGAIRVA